MRSACFHSKGRTSPKRPSDSYAGATDRAGTCANGPAGPPAARLRGAARVRLGRRVRGARAPRPVGAGGASRPLCRSAGWPCRGGRAARGQPQRGCESLPCQWLFAPVQGRFARAHGLRCTAARRKRGGRCTIQWQLAAARRRRAGPRRGAPHRPVPRTHAHTRSRTRTLAPPTHTTLESPHLHPHPHPLALARPSSCCLRTAPPPTGPPLTAPRRSSPRAHPAPRARRRCRGAARSRGCCCARGHGSACRTAR